MTSVHSILRQDEERAERLVLIAEGEATPLLPRFPGDLRWSFDALDPSLEVQFDNVSSVMFFDEMFTTSENFPYLKACDHKIGLFECIGSTYLDRLRDNPMTGRTFRNHRHFLYWDKHFDWHITCEEIQITQSNG
ncbi:hypothetical protein ACOXXX_21220 [Thalassococcus sp. BH17M4-6]|uniref:hypothetical protein n=1 Tax=Thalassococcus sp. BH17M4-6 TaxID=3413148 RepID=UPI003BC8A5B4